VDEDLSLTHSALVKDLFTPTLFIRPAVLADVS